MRRQIKLMLPRWDVLRKRANKLANRAANRAPDTQTKNQHFISQFWLRQFADDDIDRVAEHNVGSGKVRLLPVEEAAAKHHLYTLKGNEDTVGSHHESMMSTLESEAAPLRKKIAATQAAPSGTAGAMHNGDDYKRWVLSNYFAFIYLQSPVMMNLSDELAVARIEQLVCEFAELGLNLKPKDPVAMTQKYTFFALLENNPLVNKIACFFFCRRWSVVQVGPMPLPLLPVAPFGWGLQTAPQVWVPLAPDVLLRMSWAELPLTLTNDEVREGVRESLIRHADEDGGGVVFSHPDHKDEIQAAIKSYRRQRP